MQPQPRRVLLVDDSPLILAALRKALETSGHLVDTAQSLDELEAARSAAAPDAIVLDIQMPEAWGDDVAATLRGAYGVSVPILLMSSLPPADLEERATLASADGWVSKGDGLERVVASIEALLARRRA